MVAHRLTLSARISQKLLLYAADQSNIRQVGAIITIEGPRFSAAESTFSLVGRSLDR
jgi:hypothetical protein